MSSTELTAGWSFLANQTSNGTVHISGFSTSAVSAGSGAILQLHLQARTGLLPGHASLDLRSGSLNEGELGVDLIDGTIAMIPPTLQVLQVRELASGVALRLSEAPDLVRLNLYDGQDASVALPDLRLTASGGDSVTQLSAHWQASSSELYLLRSDAITGLPAAACRSDLLAAGTYTLTIDSRADGLVSAAQGEQLDGNGDGITGDAFACSFTRSTPPNLIAIADTARGPGQRLSRNGAALAAGSYGLPVLLSTTAALTAVQGSIRFDAAILTNGTLSKGKDLPADWTFSLQQDAAGVFTYNASGSSAISGTSLELLRVEAAVSATAPYATSTLITATLQAPQQPALSFATDPGLVLIAYAGDATGNRTHSSLDASRIQRVVLGLDSGFDAYACQAPILLADITGDGVVSTLDATGLQQRVVGLATSTFPLIGPGSIPG